MTPEDEGSLVGGIGTLRKRAPILMRSIGGAMQQPVGELSDAIKKVLPWIELFIAVIKGSAL
jgi:hypothetical protein